MDTEVIHKDIFGEKDLNSGTIMARAFKAITQIVLNLVSKNFKNYKNLVLFMGKSGKKVLEETFKRVGFRF